MSTAVTPIRALPQSHEAEQSVLGGCLLFRQAFAAVADLVAPGDFMHPAHEVIFAAMVALDADGKGIDAITVGEQMRSAETFGHLRALGGEAYFAVLETAVVTVDNIAWHADLIRSTAQVRRMTEAGQEIAARGRGAYGDPRQFLDDCERLVFEVASRSQGTSYQPIRRVMGDTVRAIEARYDRKQAITGVPSGYYGLDALTAGFQSGELTILAARPSMGKTSLAMNAVANAAIDHGIPALVFSLEMSKEALVERLLSADARVDSTRLRGGFLDQRDWINLTKSASRICEAPICIDDAGAPTLLEIRSKARRWRADPAIWKQPDALGIVVVDYLQLISGVVPGEREKNREREVAEISRGLKALAKELRVPVIALAQLNRAVESRADKRPGLADLRESGSLEQDADLIAFIYRDEVYNKETQDKGVAEVIIGKQRSGPVGTVRLAFLNQYTRFENLDARDEEPLRFRGGNAHARAGEA